MLKAIGTSRAAYLFYFIGVCVVILRSLLDSNFGKSSVTYILVPFLISLLLYRYMPRPIGYSRKSTVLSHFVDSTIIMLGTSAVIFEGFICVLFFMPIYYIGIFIAYLYAVYADKRDDNNGSHLKASIIPLIVVISAVEGLSPSTSFERQNSVTRTAVIQADIETLQHNMAQSISLPAKRHWFLSVFPLPHDIKAGSLNAGDIHKMKFTYKRWFFTNIKTGEFHLRLDTVTPHHIKTSVVRNDSYLASYMDIHGTDVHFKALGHGQTEVSLTLHYDRQLDPYWYFAPLQKFAIEKSGDYLIYSIIARDLPQSE